MGCCQLVNLGCCAINLRHVTRFELHKAEDGCCTLCIHLCEGEKVEHHFDTHAEAEAAYRKLCESCDCCHCCE